MKNSLAGSPWLFSDGLAAVLIKNKWGYIDRQGHVAIAPQYTAASGFSEGLAAVEVNNKYFTEGVAACSIGDGFHIIDRNGRVLAELGEDCTDVENFSCGLAAAEFIVGDGDWRYGAIDRTGKMVIKPKFSFAYTFEEDLMPVVVNDGDKCGFVNKEGKFAIAPEFDETESFSEGLAPAKKDGKWRFINDGDKCGFVNKEGKFAIAPEFDETESFSEGLAPAMKDGKWRFIDHEGHDVVMLGERFDHVDTLIEGRSIVKIGDKSGAIDKAGNLIIDVRFDNLHSFSEGLAYARIGDTHGFINPSGIFEIQKPVTKATLIDKLMKRGNWLRW